MRQYLLLSLVALSAALLAACGGGAPDDVIVEHQVVEVTAVYDPASNQHLFRSDADTVAAGWTTFRFINASPMLHFVFLDHLPGDRTSEELLSEVSPVFQEAMNLINAGRPDDAAAQFATLPEWFGDLVFRGGPGFTSPGHVSEATLYLEPGNYVLECYIKTADGVFHWNLGMYRDLHVTEEITGAQPPQNPTIEVTLTDSTLVAPEEVRPGEHVVAVHFQEEEPGLIGRDIHVARLDPGIDQDEIVRWMDFNRLDGLVSTADNPGPAIFLGGIHEMPYGNTAYFNLTLEPGEYLWISEQPMDASTYRRFTVR